MKELCKRFASQHKIHILLKQRGGHKMSREVKSNPLRRGGLTGRTVWCAQQGGKEIAARVDLGTE